MNAYDSAMTKIRNGQKIFRDNTVVSLLHEMQYLNDKNKSFSSQLAEKDKEIDAADAALTHVVDCMKNPNNRGSKTLLQTCRFFDDLINTAIKIRARIV